MKSKDTKIADLEKRVKLLVEKNLLFQKKIHVLENEIRKLNNTTNTTNKKKKKKTTKAKSPTRLNSTLAKMASEIRH